MPTSRSYQDACGIARALDVVGERWALLIVRELLLGPQRFTDLRQALPGVRSNVLADRLRELAGHGVIHRRKVQPLAAAAVYELTPWGRTLEPIVLALGDWGLRVALPAAPTTLSATSVLLFLRSVAQPDPAAPDTVVQLDLDNRVWTVRLAAGHLEVQPGEPTAADVSLRADARSFNALLSAPDTLDAAVRDGTIGVAGDRAALRRLLQAVSPPPPR